MRSAGCRPAQGGPTPTGSPSPPKDERRKITSFGGGTRRRPPVLCNCGVGGLCPPARQEGVPGGRWVLFLWDVSLDFWIGLSRLARASTICRRVI